MANTSLTPVFPLLCALSGLVVGGCASVPEGTQDPRDPLQGYNRWMTSFNQDFDKAIYTPVAEGYKKITPEPVDQGVTNFFANQLDIISLLNNVLQLKPQQAASSLGRVTFNSTFGLLGVIDVATAMDIPRYREDFGQTLGHWGVGPGPYFVWPILGPNTVRDSVGTVVGWYSTPVAYLEPAAWPWGLAILYSVDLRADLLGTSDILQQAALDPYVFVRDAYLQKRLNDVYDGHPPNSNTEALFDEILKEKSAAPAK